MKRFDSIVSASLKEREKSEATHIRAKYNLEELFGRMFMKKVRLPSAEQQQQQQQQQQ